MDQIEHDTLMNIAGAVARMEPVLGVTEQGEIGQLQATLAEIMAAVKAAPPPAIDADALGDRIAARLAAVTPLSPDVVKAAVLAALEGVRFTAGG